jgi:hypothetical protein
MFALALVFCVVSCRKKSLKIPKGGNQIRCCKLKEDSTHNGEKENDKGQTMVTGFVTRLTRRVSLVEQELPTRPEHLSSPSVISGVCINRSLIFYVFFVDRCLSFCTFSFGHCVVCTSTTYGFWLPPFGIFKLFFLQDTTQKTKARANINITLHCIIKLHFYHY